MPKPHALTEGSLQRRAERFCRGTNPKPVANIQARHTNLEDHHRLAIFDLLKKPDLSGAGIRRIKQVAVELLRTLKAEKLRVDQWRDKESTRDAVQVAIRGFLWSDETGLPADSYSDDDVTVISANVYLRVFRAYPEVRSPFCERAEAT